MRTWIRNTLALLPVLTSIVSVPSVLAQADQAQTVLTAMRAAMGGDAKINALKSLSAEGTYRRTMGEREMSGDLELYFVLPDKFQRVDQFQLPNGMPGPRVLQTYNGTTGWFDSQGGSGGGFMMRVNPGGPGGGPGGPGGPAGPGGGPGGPPRDPTPRIREEYLHILLGILPVSQGTAGLTFTHAGQADSNDGTADVLDVKGGDNFTARLFVDAKTHLPLMLTYMAPQMRAIGFQRRDNETPEQVRKRFEEERAKLAAQGPPPMVENTLFVAEHQKVDGVMLPTRLTRAIDGKTVEELEIKKYKANPTIDPQQFEKKGS
jgi:hypothetical protein